MRAKYFLWSLYSTWSIVISYYNIFCMCILQVFRNKSLKCCNTLIAPEPKSSLDMFLMSISFHLILFERKHWGNAQEDNLPNHSNPAGNQQSNTTTLSFGLEKYSISAPFRLKKTFNYESNVYVLNALHCFHYEVCRIKLTLQNHTFNCRRKIPHLGIPTLIHF